MAAEVRQVTENNFALIKKLVAIEKEAFGRGGLNEWGLPPLIYHGAVYIIEADNSPAGIAEYMRDLEEAELAYLYGLAIAQEYRGQGLGKQLLKESLQQVKDKGIKQVELTVDPDNDRACTLYRNFGFEEIERRQDEYGVGEDRLIMVREL